MEKKKGGRFIFDRPLFEARRTGLRAALRDAWGDIPETLPEKSVAVTE